MPSLEELAEGGDQAALSLQRFRELQVDGSLDEFDIDAILSIAEEAVKGTKGHTLLPLDLPYLAYQIERKVLTDQLQYLDSAAEDNNLRGRINMTIYQDKDLIQRIGPYATLQETLLWDEEDKGFEPGLIHRDRRL